VFHQLQTPPPLRTIQELENIIKIIAPFNQKLSLDDVNSLKEQQVNQDKLISLKIFPRVHSLLLELLNIDNYKEWPKCTWKQNCWRFRSTFEQIMPINATENQHSSQNLKGRFGLIR
jgi:hypothetical protein